MDKVPKANRRQRAADAGRYAPRLRVILACALWSPFLSIAAPPTFVGLQLPPYPSDCKVGEGAVLGSGPPYRLGYEHLICGSDEIVVFLRVIEHRDSVARWDVIDEVWLSIPAGQRMWGVLKCSRVHHDGDAVFAVGTFVKVADTRVMRRFEADNVTQAWRFDLEAERIEPIAASDVSCGWDSYD
jgi:hypothetical protein